jgi:signal transduction histidine kinase
MGPPMTHPLPWMAWGVATRALAGQAVSGDRHLVAPFPNGVLLEVRLALADGLPLLWADPHQLHQVVVNLVSNAHQAMCEISPPRRLMVTTRFDPPSARISLEVADTGPGIPPEIQARIFEPFFTTKPVGVGTGLGLSPCQGIIEGHGGTIGLTSTAGRGTVFRIELPMTLAK